MTITANLQFVSRATILIAVSASLSGCIKPHLANTSTMAPSYVAQARSTCLQYGATPGTRLFYSCMRSQVRKVQYNHAADACQNDYHITETCEQAFSYGDFNYFAKVGQCKADLIAKCQQNASAEYLRRNNAKKLNIRLHDYNHNYNHNQP